MTEHGVSSFSYTPPPGLSFTQWMSEWQEKLAFAQEAYENLPYILGDFINVGEDHWPQEYAQIFDGQGLSVRVVNRWSFVARHVKPEARQHAPSHTHAYHVCRLGESDQIKMLDLAKNEGWSALKLQREVRERYPNPNEKRGRPKKVKKSFDQWIESYFEANGYTTKEDADGTYVSPSVVSLMSDAFQAGVENR